MIQRILLLMHVCLISTLAMGQSDSKTINSIKRDNAYLYEEVTAKDADEAYQLAYELLRQRVDAYVKEEKGLKSAENIIIKDTQQIQMQRGDMIRVFLYVKKKDIQPVESNVAIIRNDNNKKAETPQKENKESSAFETTIEVIQAPADEPAQNFSDETAQTSGDEPVWNSGDESLKLQAAWQQDMIEDLLKCKTIAQAKVLLNRLKAEYKVKRYGSYATCPNKATCFWITSDEQGNLLSVWGAGTGERTNFRTLTRETVNIDSKAVWFTMAK